MLLMPLEHIQGWELSLKNSTNRNDLPTSRDTRTAHGAEMKQRSGDCSEIQYVAFT